MDHVVRKISVVFIFFCFFVLTGCSEHVSSVKIVKQAEQFMECIADRDAEKLFGYFPQDMKDNREELTMEEIQKAFDSIDGNIESYEYSGNGGSDSTEKGKIKYYYRNLEFRNVTTNTGKTYMINFSYQHIWSEYPEREGLCKIVIYQGDNYDYDNAFIIGRDYEDESW